jgi:hypothetical protein
VVGNGVEQLCTAKMLTMKLSIPFSRKRCLLLNSAMIHRSGHCSQVLTLRLRELEVRLNLQDSVETCRVINLIFRTWGQKCRDGERLMFKSWTVLRVVSFACFSRCWLKDKDIWTSRGRDFSREKSLPRRSEYEHSAREYRSNFCPESRKLKNMKKRNAIFQVRLLRCKTHQN